MRPQRLDAMRSIATEVRMEHDVACGSRALRQKTMVRLHMEAFSYVEIADLFGVTRERVRQIVDPWYVAERERGLREFRIAVLKLQLVADTIASALRDPDGPVRPTTGLCSGCGARLKLLRDGSVSSHFVYERAVFWVYEPDDPRPRWERRHCEGSRRPPAPPPEILSAAATPEDYA